MTTENKIKTNLESCIFNNTETTVQEILGYDPFVNEEFALPKNWRLKITKENSEIINNWRNNIKKINCLCPDNFIGEHGFGTSNQWGIEITFDQFKKYVLKESIETPKEVIPEYVEYNKIIRKVKEWTANSYCILEDGQQPFKNLVKPSTKEAFDAQNKPKQPLKQAVHCKTQKEWDFVLSEFNPKNVSGIKFNANGKVLVVNHFDSSYIGSFGNLEDVKGYQILSFQEWCDLNGYKTGNEVKSNQEFKVRDWIYPLETGFNCTSHFLYKNQYKKNELMQIEAFDLYNGYNVAVSTKGHVVYIEQYCKKFRLATPEEINNHLISIGQIPAGKPLNTGIESNKSNTYQAISIQRDANPLYTFNSIKINGQEILKPKMTLSIDDEELPMVNIIKTNSIKQLLNND